MKKYLKRWIELLKNTEIDSKYHEKVLEYIDNCIVSDIDDNVLIPDLNYQNYIPLTIKILSKIDLSKVEFINDPFRTTDFGLVVKKSFTDDDIVNDVVSFINKKMDEGYNVRIYRVINHMKKIDNVTILTLRMIFEK